MSLGRAQSNFGVIELTVESQHINSRLTSDAVFFNCLSLPRNWQQKSDQMR